MILFEFFRLINGEKRIARGKHALTSAQKMSQPILFFTVIQKFTINYSMHQHWIVEFSSQNYCCKKAAINMQRWTLIRKDFLPWLANPCNFIVTTKKIVTSASCKLCLIILVKSGENKLKSAEMEKKRQMHTYVVRGQMYYRAGSLFSDFLSQYFGILNF